MLFSFCGGQNYVSPIARLIRLGGNKAQGALSALLQERIDRVLLHCVPHLNLVHEVSHMSRKLLQCHQTVAECVIICGIKYDSYDSFLYRRLYFYQI